MRKKMTDKQKAAQLKRRNEYLEQVVKIKEDRIEILKDENANILLRHTELKKIVIEELRLQLGCKDSEYYTPKVIITRILDKMFNSKLF